MVAQVWERFIAPKNRAGENENESDKIRQLEKEKRELESALAKTQVRLLAMETLIDVAEAHYKIEIKKTVEPNPAKPECASTVSRSCRDRQRVWLQPSRLLQAGLAPETKLRAEEASMLEAVRWELQQLSRTGARKLQHHPKRQGIRLAETGYCGCSRSRGY